MGNLNIFWRPKVPGIKEWLKTFLPVPALSLPVQPLAVSVNIPHDVHVGSVVPVEYKIQNTRMELLDLTLMVDSNDHFVFSGLKSSRLRLLPLGTQTFKFQFVPLTSGHCKLPHVRVMLSEEAEFKNVDFMTSLGQVSGVSDDLSIFIRPLIGW